MNQSPPTALYPSWEDMSVTWDQWRHSIRMKSWKVNESLSENGSLHQWQAAVLMVPPCEELFYEPKHAAIGEHRPPALPLHQWCSHRNTGHYTQGHLSAEGHNDNKGLPRPRDEPVWYFIDGSYRNKETAGKSQLADVTLILKIQMLKWRKTHWNNYLGLMLVAREDELTQISNEEDITMTEGIRRCWKNCGRKKKVGLISHLTFLW